MVLEYKMMYYVFGGECTLEIECVSNQGGYLMKMKLIKEQKFKSNLRY